MIETTSVETSKILRESGFQQNTQLKWVRCFGKMRLFDSESKPMDRGWPEVYTAPTIAELLGELPYSLRYIESDYWLWITKGKYCYEVRYTDAHHQYPKYVMQEEQLVEALAKMWLRLKIDGVMWVMYA